MTSLVSKAATNDDLQFTGRRTILAENNTHETNRMLKTKKYY